jgi:hypothetical protein
MNVMLDTLSITRRLRGAGFTEEQVDAVAQAVRDAASLPDISHLATKEDLALTRAELKSDVAELKAELKIEFAELKTEFTDQKAELTGKVAEIRTDVTGKLAVVSGAIAGAKTETLKRVFVMIMGSLALNLGGMAGLIKLLAH